MQRSKPTSSRALTACAQKSFASFVMFLQRPAAASRPVCTVVFISVEASSHNELFVKMAWGQNDVIALKGVMFMV